MFEYSFLQSKYPLTYLDRCLYIRESKRLVGIVSSNHRQRTLGTFLCKWIPKRTGAHVAMVRFNGENLQDKWAKINVTSGNALTSLLHKEKKQVKRHGHCFGDGCEYNLII